MSKRRKPEDTPADPTGAQGAGQKPVGSDPEPLVADRGDTDATVQLKKLDEVDHGRDTEVELAADRSQEADEGDSDDASTSAEAADQDEVPSKEVQAAEATAATKAADLAALESEVGREALELGVTAAGDREDHLRSVTVAARAARTAIDEGSGNVARARAFAAVEDLPAVDSPHGRVAEDHDPWAGARWAPHGDQNVPADSDALSTFAADVDRGLNPKADNKAAKKFKEGESVEDVRERENKEALKLARAEKVDSKPAPARRQRRHTPTPDATEED